MVFRFSTLFKRVFKACIYLFNYTIGNEALILQIILLQCVFVFIYRCIRRGYLDGARSEAECTYLPGLRAEKEIYL